MMVALPMSFAIWVFVPLLLFESQAAQERTTWREHYYFDQVSANAFLKHSINNWALPWHFFPYPSQNPGFDHLRPIHPREFLGDLPVKISLPVVLAPPRAGNGGVSQKLFFSNCSGMHFSVNVLLQGYREEIVPSFYAFSKKPLPIHELATTGLPLLSKIITSNEDKLFPPLNVRGWQRNITVGNRRPDGYPGTTFVYLGDGPKLDITAVYRPQTQKLFLNFHQAIPSSDVVQFEQSVKSVIQKYVREHTTNNIVLGDLVFRFRLHLRHDAVCVQISTQLRSSSYVPYTPETHHTLLIKVFAGQLFPVEEATPFFQNAETRLLKPLPPLVLSIEGSLGVSLFDFTQDSTQRYNYLDSNTHASFQVFFDLASVKGKYTCHENDVLAQSGTQEHCISLGAYGIGQVLPTAYEHRILLQCNGRVPENTWAIFGVITASGRVLRNKEVIKPRTFKKEYRVRLCTKSGWSQPQPVTEERATKLYKECRLNHQNAESETPVFG